MMRKVNLINPVRDTNVSPKFMASHPTFVIFHLKPNVDLPEVHHNERDSPSSEEESFSLG